MNDNEITKALECCDEGCQEGYCLCECPRSVLNDDWDKCKAKLMQNALALINRQKAEIEALKLINSTYVATTNEIRETAIKEFAERLKKEKYYSGNRMGYGTWVTEVKCIDNLVKETVGERE